MAYSSTDQMVNDLLASMNLDLGGPKDKAYVDGQLAKKSLEYKLADDEEYKKSADNAEKAKKLTSFGSGDSSDSSGGKDFNLSNDDISGIIDSFMS